MSAGAEYTPPSAGEGLVIVIWLSKGVGDPACQTAAGLVPVNAAQQRRFRGVSLAWQVLYAGPRGRQGLAGDPVMVAAQQQVHRMPPLGSRRDDHPNHRLCRAAARPVLTPGRQSWQGLDRRRAAESRRALVRASVRKHLLHDSSIRPRPYRAIEAYFPALRAKGPVKMPGRVTPSSRPGAGRPRWSAGPGRP